MIILCLSAIFAHYITSIGRKHRKFDVLSSVGHLDWLQHVGGQMADYDYLRFVVFPARKALRLLRDRTICVEIRLSVDVSSEEEVQCDGEGDATI